MKVIMRKDVKGVGQKGSVKDVSDGYALNYLIPNGLAEQATPDKVAANEKNRQMLAKESAAREAEYAAMAARLSGGKLQIQARANTQGHLYKQLSAVEVVNEIRKVFGVNVPEEFVVMSAPIKQIGDVEISLKLGTQIAKLGLIIKQA